MNTLPDKELKPAQKRFLNSIELFYREKGHNPTLKEMSVITGNSTHSLKDRARQLKALGILKCINIGRRYEWGINNL